MARTQSLGDYEQLVLLAILRLGNVAYGVSIRTEIETRAGRSTSSGALYTTLERLEDKGFVSFRVGDPSPKRGGRAKRHYRVTSAGQKAVTQSQLAYQKMLKGLNILAAVHE
jgi:DNA-binding PadR family transcriptional regulator